MNVAALAAGPDLDRLIAEKVMGWDIQYQRKIYGPEDSFQPSISLDHAWEVVGQLHCTMRHFSLFYCETQCEWLCRLDKRRCVENDARITAWAETVPLAICRAALMAVGA